MKGISSFLIIAIVMLISSCKDDKVVEPEMDYSGADLTTQLAHYKYSDPQYYVQFFPEGWFIQKQYRDRDDDGVLEFMYERTGNYKLIDNQIILSNISVDYNQSLGGVSIIWSDQEVSLVNGRINFTPVTALNGREIKNELWNYWTTVKLVYHYVESPETIYNGREEYFYEFMPENPKVRWGWDYLDGKPWSPTEYKSEYVYTPPELYLKNMVENYRVEFKNNKMYWYYKPLLNKSSITSVSARPLFPESIEYK